MNNKKPPVIHRGDKALEIIAALIAAGLLQDDIETRHTAHKEISDVLGVWAMLPNSYPTGVQPYSDFD